MAPSSHNFSPGLSAIQLPVTGWGSPYSFVHLPAYSLQCCPVTFMAFTVQILSPLFWASVMEQLKCLEAVSIRMEPSGAVWLIPLILREFSSLSTFGKGARGGGGGLGSYNWRSCCFLHISGRYSRFYLFISNFERGLRFGVLGLRSSFTNHPFCYHSVVQRNCSFVKVSCYCMPLSYPLPSLMAFPLWFWPLRWNNYQWPFLC